MSKSPARFPRDPRIALTSGLLVLAWVVQKLFAVVFWLGIALFFVILIVAAIILP